MQVCISLLTHTQKTLSLLTFMPRESVSFGESVRKRNPKYEVENRKKIRHGSEGLNPISNIALCYYHH